MDLPLIAATELKAIPVILNWARSFVERTKRLMHKTPPVLHQIIISKWRIIQEIISPKPRGG